MPAGMKSARKNHPGERFFIGRDEIGGVESSLREIFYPAGMRLAGENHLWERFFIRRDEISIAEGNRVLGIVLG